MEDIVRTAVSPVDSTSAHNRAHGIHDSNGTLQLRQGEIDNITHTKNATRNFNAFLSLFQ
jgi:hypothetical protein